MSRHSERASPALQALAEADPALAALSLWCSHRDGDVTASGASTITYGPDFDRLMRHEQQGLAAHHILHVALRHATRMAELEARLGDAFEPKLFNLAADAVVNETVLIADHALPRPAVRLTELLEKTLKQKTTSLEALAEWDVERLYFALVKPSEGSGRMQDKAEVYAQEQQFEGDLEPEEGGGSDEDDRAEAAARWRQHIARAMDTGRQAGRGIGRALHRLADVEPARVPWEVLLRRLLTRAVTVLPQPEARRPARRWLAGAAQAQRAGTPTPGFQPGNRPLTEVPVIAVGLDASSSVDDARLGLFWSEVVGIAQRMRAVLHLLVFDDAIRHRAQLSPGQTRFNVPELPRGGGTAFQPVIREAQALEASALVMLTDLEGDAGPPPRGLPVFWTVPDASGVEPPFGRLIDMSG